MKNTHCNTRNHRHGVFCILPSSRNFRTRVIPYYSIFGIYGMSKTLDSGCSKKKTIRPYRKCKKRLGFFNWIFFSLRKKGKKTLKSCTMNEHNKTITGPNFCNVFFQKNGFLHG